MNKLFSTIIIAILLMTACNSSSSGSGQSISKVKDEIVAINIPFQEHGYHNLASQIISSTESFNAFIVDVDKQQGWNHKDDFLQKIKSKVINYEKNNLFLYRLTETSSSNKLTVSQPKYDGNNNVIIKIKRDVAEVGDAAMAYYLLAYIVDKKVSQLTFDDGKQEATIENSATAFAVPKNCLTWSEGCNSCGRTENGEAVCTQPACPNSIKEFRCEDWGD